MVNQETIFNWLQEKKYKELKEFLYRGKDKIKSDIMLLSATKIVEDEFVRNSKLDTETNEFWETLEMLQALHPNHYEFQSDNYKQITVSLASRYKDNPKISIRYAKLFPNEEISKDIIRLHSQTEIQVIEHNKHEFIKVTHNPIPAKIDARTSLFKSIAEQKMFLALKQIFDTYQVYPNVAVSNIINIEAINSQLTQKEKDYFYKSIIDFVIFEPFKGYKPIYFFELDSLWHDTEKIEEKDRIKDKIFSIAGLKLLRIRHKENMDIDEDTFHELLREIRDQIQQDD